MKPNKIVIPSKFTAKEEASIFNRNSNFSMNSQCLDRWALIITLHPLQLREMTIFYQLTRSITMIHSSNRLKDLTKLSYFHNLLLKKTINSIKKKRFSRNLLFRKKLNKRRVNSFLTNQTIYKKSWKSRIRNKDKIWSTNLPNNKSKI